MKENDFNISKRFEIDVISNNKDFNIKGSERNKIHLSMPNSYMAQSEDFFLSIYKIACNIQQQAESVENQKWVYIRDILVVIGGILIGIWKPSSITIGFITIILGFFLCSIPNFKLSGLKGSSDSLVSFLDTIIDETKKKEIFENSKNENL